MFHAKYIILRQNKSIIIFSPDLNHNEVADGREIFSAGFVRVGAMMTPHYTEMGPEMADIDIYCFGESENLGIKSSPKQDEQLIRRMLAGG